MKKVIKNSLILATIFAGITNLQAQAVELSEVGGDCPSAEISYLSNLTTYTYMEGTGTIGSDWDADKYSFTPGTDGTLKVHLSAPGTDISIKIDSVCNGSGIFRSTKQSDHGVHEFSVTADETIDIGLWDWVSGSGYTFDLNIEFTPDDEGTIEASKISLTQTSTSVDEGDTHTYTLTLDRPSNEETVVTVAIGHLTTDSADIEETTKDITIPAGETTVTFTVDTLDDSLEESSESFSVLISNTNNSNVTIDEEADNVTTNITDNDSTSGGEVPIATAQTVTVNENSSVAIVLTGTDADGDSLSFTTTDPSNGTLSGTAPNIVYTPNADYNGADSFTFTANDGTSDSAPATISITVIDTETPSEITENESLTEHFIGMPINIAQDKTVINGTITADWDMDRYSFNANNLGVTSITLKDDSAQDMPFFVIRNYDEMVAGDAELYDLGSDFSVITIMIIAQSNTASTYTLTIETPDETPDTTPPVIELIGDESVNLTVGEAYADEGATASDNKDGDISTTIIINNEVDTDTAGTYIVTYNVSDTAGNSAAEISRTVIVSQAQDLYANWTVAKNYLVQDASKDIGTNTMKVLIEPNQQIGEDDTSRTVDFIYGKINGADIGLGINQNYTAGTKMVVRVYDSSGNTLATSEELTYLGSDNDVEFNPLTF